MSKKHLQCAPHKLRGTTEAWWYEEVEGVYVAQEVRDVQGCILASTRVTLIPWAAIRGALRRLDKKP